MSRELSLSQLEWVHANLIFGFDEFAASLPLSMRSDETAWAALAILEDDMLGHSVARRLLERGGPGDDRPFVDVINGNLH
jgi:hypothetical protein